MFDKADLITRGNYRTRFDYGIGRSRYQRVDESKAPGASFSVDKITTYLGTVEFIEDLDSSESYHLRRIGGAALQRFYPGTQVRQTPYLLKDHLGSIHTILDDTGAVDERIHFGAFGERMEAFDWQVPASPARAAMLNAITTRGFTGHEHADRLGIIQTR